jgi:hypothetical protein
MAWVAPRGIGPTEWTRDTKERTQIRRRFALLGQTDDGMRVWDVRRAIGALRSIPEAKSLPLWLQGERDAAVWCLYAALFEPDVKRLDLHELPPSHTSGPALLNVLRSLDVPQALALAAERAKVILYVDDPAQSNVAEFARQTAEKLGWKNNGIQVRDVSRHEVKTKPPQAP